MMSKTMEGFIEGFLFPALNVTCVAGAFIVGSWWSFIVCAGFAAATYLMLYVQCLEVMDA